MDDYLPEIGGGERFDAVPARQAPPLIADELAAKRLRLRVLEDAGPAPWGNVPARKPAEFLWQPYIPLGQLTVVCGPPSVGKGTAIADIAARATTGRGWPMSAAGGVSPRDVLWCETEDSDCCTLAPRFEAAGANIDRIHIAKIGDPVLADMRRTIIENDLGLVVLSPFVSFIPELADANNELAARAALQGMLEQVEDTRCAILGIMHPNKQTGAPTLARVMGSTAFVAFVRSVVILGEIDEQKRFVHAKHNLSPRGPDLLYSIVDEGRDPRDGLIRAEWAPAADNCHVESIWNQKAAKRAKAADWLVAHLTMEGEQPANDVMVAGVAAGYTAAAVQKAAHRSKRIATRKEEFHGPWLWSVNDDG